jgi:putative redox protein
MGEAWASEQRLRWLGDPSPEPRFEGADANGRRIAIGGDEGARGSDLLPVSLAACTAYDVVVILRKQRQDLRGLEVVISSEQDPDPPWTFRRIGLHFVVIGDVDPGRAERAIELAERKYCSVAATIRGSVEIDLSSEVVPG